MSTHTSHAPQLNDKVHLQVRGMPQAVPAFLVVGILALAAAVFLSRSDDAGLRRFFFAYLIAFAFFTSFCIGGLFFTLIQHVTRAGWSVVVRRVPEALAGILPVMGVLTLPLLYSVWQLDGGLYRWAQPIENVAPHHEFSWDHAQTGQAADSHSAAAHSPATPAADPQAATTLSNPPPVPMDYANARHHHPAAFGVPKLDHFAIEKRPWLNPAFFTGRIIGYFVILGAIGWLYWRASVKQDTNGDPEIKKPLAILAAPLIFVFGLMVTFLTFDLIMSLDHTWYSTMLGVYYFAGSIMATFGFVALAYLLLQEMGLLTKSITTEHYHDLGKLMFGFMFFWSYVAFSQYMLLWYASIPETVPWLARRGATTAALDVNFWSTVSIVLLFGHTLLPFLGLISRHVKRHRLGLAFWAIWLVGFHYVDMTWLIGPELDGAFRFGAVEVLALIGVCGIFMAALVRKLQQAALIPVKDPRLADSLAFQNY